MTFIKENKDQFGLTGFNATSRMVFEIKGNPKPENYFTTQDVVFSYNRILKTSDLSAHLNLKAKSIFEVLYHKKFDWNF